MLPAEDLKPVRASAPETKLSAPLPAYREAEARQTAEGKKNPSPVRVRLISKEDLKKEIQAGLPVEAQ